MDIYAETSSEWLQKKMQKSPGNCYRTFCFSLSLSIAENNGKLIIYFLQIEKRDLLHVFL